MRASKFKNYYTNNDFLKDELKATENVVDQLIMHLASAYCNLNKLQNNTYNQERASLSYWKRYAKWQKELQRMRK